MNDSRPARAATAVARALSSLAYGSGRSEKCKAIQPLTAGEQLRDARSGLLRQRLRIRYARIPAVHPHPLHVHARTLDL